MAFDKQNIRATDDSAATHSFNEDILSVARHQDREAFIRLFNYFAPRVKSFMLKHKMPGDVAEELAQETLIALWRNAEKFNPVQANASTWIYTIARNKRIDMIRKSARRREDAVEFIPDTLEDGATSVEELVIHTNQSERIKEVIDTLPRDQADIVYKSYFEGLTHAEIAVKANIPLGTVKSRLRLAMDRLRHAIAMGNTKIGKGH